jgi:hypothetical protein
MHTHFLFFIFYFSAFYFFIFLAGLGRAQPSIISLGLGPAQPIWLG